MGPQARQLSGHRYSLVSEITDNMMAVTKERMLSGSGSAGSTGSPGRLHHENISRDSGIGCLKVEIILTLKHWTNFDGQRFIVQCK